MTALADLLTEDADLAAFDPFAPSAVYHPPLDCITYLREDVSYRADRVDQFTTILWHPEEDRAVGVKLKGGRYLFERVKAILSPLGHDLTDHTFLPLMSALQLALTMRDGERITTRAEAARLERQTRRTRLYDEAFAVVGDARVDVRELRMAS